GSRETLVDITAEPSQLLGAVGNAARWQQNLLIPAQQGCGIIDELQLPGESLEPLVGTGHLRTEGIQERRRARGLTAWRRPHAPDWPSLGWNPPRVSPAHRRAAHR